MNPTISIIVPVYNVEAYLNRCLDSIMNQDFPDYEVLLVNDGSTDSSGIICDDYAARDNRFKSICIQNSGPSRARNVALDQAKGDFITFIDSDDWVHPCYLNHMFDVVNKMQADIVCVDHIKTTGMVDVQSLTDYQLTQFSNLEILNQFGKQNHRYLTTVWGKLYKRELLENIRFIEGKYHEDVDFVYRVLYLSKLIVLSSAVLYYYLKRPESITGKISLNRMLDFIEIQAEKIIFLKRIGLEEQFSLQLKNLLKQMVRTLVNYKLKKTSSEYGRFNDTFNLIKHDIRIGQIGIKLYIIFSLYRILPYQSGRMFAFLGKLLKK